MRSGMLQRAGIAVDLTITRSGPAAAQAVVGGTFDMAKGSITSMLNAHLRGIPFVAIAPGAVYRDVKQPFGEMMVDADSAIRSPKDLSGKTIGVTSLNGLDQTAVEAFVDRGGGDWHSLHFVEMPQVTMEAALETQRVDAVTIVYPILGQMLQNPKLRVLGPAYSAVGSLWLVSAFYATADWADHHRDVAQRFSRVLTEAAAYTNTHHAETAPMLAEFSSIPLEVIQHMVRTDCGTSLDTAQIQPVIDAAAKYGVIAHGFPAAELVWNGASAK
jgi:NitT/TauT family transport system substrate-binding protein